MNTNSRTAGPATRTPNAAFSLIELIVVIAIIALLASLIFPIAAAAKKAQIRNRAKAEMEAIQTAIEEYKSKMGYYPPDNAPNWTANQLYFELLGTTNIPSGNGIVYHTLDDSAQINASDLAAAIGPNISGFMNVSKGGEDGVPARNFAKNIKAAQFMSIKNTLSAPASMAFGMPGATYPGPTLLTSATGSGAQLNPWRYNSSSPRFNPKSFDLWIDITVGDHTERICNWSDRPIVITTPY